ncbi:TetR/AcrR family transcriptional regulator [Alteromonas sp. M12]|uniref:TetR/AcrR family transcriptional regulator n=1 Tax=Alteromonas sp. M12 TaxID=3135644 RepID=UPI00319E53C0
MSKTKANNCRNKILQVSTGLFASLGFEGVTMRQIAFNAEITMPSIYHHFGNKEELYRAVEKEMYGTYSGSLLNELQAKAHPEEKLRNFITNVIDSFETNPEFLKLLQRNLVEDDEKNQKFLVDLSLQNVYDELKMLLNEYSPKSGDGIEPLIIFSIVLGFFTMQPVSQMLNNYEYAQIDAKQKRDLLINAVMASITKNES